MPDTTMLYGAYLQYCSSRSYLYGSFNEHVEAARARAEQDHDTMTPINLLIVGLGGYSTLRG
jgi:hypothetical protein